ncbi:MAG: ChbG/HpnK family deacetylase [Elusimicrobiota bacterium]
MRELIVTADDFGYDSAVNEAVCAAYRDGVLRYASLMVDRGAAGEAVLLAQANPGLGVGLHLELCADHPAYWGLRYFFGRQDRARLEGEITRQIEKLLSFGLKPTHVDGHFNIHVHPVIFPLLARLALRYGIPRIRLPMGELRPSLSYTADYWRSEAAGSPVRGVSRSPLAGRLAVGGVFGALGRALKGSAAGLSAPPAWGLLHSGMMTEDYMLWLVRRLPEGVSEIYFHPSSDPASAVSLRPTATHHTVTELGTLLSPRLRQTLAQEGVRLVEVDTADVDGPRT